MWVLALVCQDVSDIVAETILTQWLRGFRHGGKGELCKVRLPYLG